MHRTVPLLLVLASIFFLGCIGGGPAGVDTGKVYFSITDKQLDMANVTSVEVAISEIQVHKTEAEIEGNDSEVNETETNEPEANETDEPEGWVTVLNESKTYDLLKLTGIDQLLATADLQAGSYNKIRLYILNVSVVLNGQAQEAKLPSSKIDIKVHFTVTANSSSLISLDFNLNDSLHITGDGKIIMAPVIKVEVDREVEVEIENDGEVKKIGGERETETEVGMDEHGNVSEGNRIGANDNITVENNQIRIQREVRHAQQYDVSVRNSGLSPAHLTIAKGDTVRWIMRDSFSHRIVSDNNFDSSARYQDQIWSHVFNQTGNFTYYDMLAPSVAGTIVVEE